MAKQKGFKLKQHEPFPVYGSQGEYEIPPLEKLKYDDWQGVAELVGGADTRRILEAYKEFFLRICPGLEAEDIGDNQWLQLGTAYFEEQGER